MLADGGVRFRCRAFSRLHADIILLRTWRMVQPDTFVFEEKIEGSSRVQFESRICLGDADWDSVQRSSAAESAQLRWQGADGSTAEMSIQTPAGLQVSARPCSFLQEYGVEKQGRVLLLSGCQQLPFEWNAQWRLRKAA
jgi:hypothetical protein